MRTTRKHHIGFWKGIAIVALGIIGWFFIGWCHLQFNKIPSAIVSTVLWCIVIGFVAWLIKKCADEENLTVRSWFKKLLRQL